jgi:hypothetical protein
MTGHSYRFTVALVAIAAAIPMDWYGRELVAQETPPAAAAPVDDEAERFRRFSENLSGTKFTGSFVVSGREGDGLQSEEYHIKSVQKMEGEDMWLFTARIRYGENDITVPLPLPVKWAGDTPVISVTDLRFLGQGPFNARVVIHDDKYAGTWSHGDVHGHLFGTITRLEPEDEDAEKKSADDSAGKKSDGGRDQKSDGDGGKSDDGIDDGDKAQIR